RSAMVTPPPDSRSTWASPTIAESPSRSVSRDLVAIEESTRIGITVERRKPNGPSRECWKDRPDDPRATEGFRSAEVGQTSASQTWQVSKMIIDAHGHYTTVPPALGEWRDRQVAAVNGDGPTPDPADLV